MIRRMLVLAVAILFLAAAPVAAQGGDDSYGPGVNPGGGSQGGAAAQGGGDLAETGTDLDFLAPLGAAMVVAGGLVVLTTRKRQTRHRLPTAA